MQAVRDFRQSLSRLFATPITSAFLMLTLGLAVGAVASAHSFLDSLLANSRAIASPESLLVLTEATSTSGRRVSIMSEDFAELRLRPEFAQAVGWTPFRTVLCATGANRIVSGELVSGDYFAVLGVKPAAGRLLRSADDTMGSPPVVVLSNWLWRAEFESRADVVGSVVLLRGQPTYVVGVAPEFFAGADITGFRTPAFWSPLSVWMQSRSSSTRNLRIAIRLSSPTDLARTQAALDVLTGQLDDYRPLTAGFKPDRQRHWRLIPVTARPSVGQGRLLGFVTVVVPLLVLLVAASNLAQTMFYRGMARRTEFAVRQALGATRMAIMRQPIMEATIVAVVGTVLGFWVSQSLVDVIIQQLRNQANAIPEFQLQAGVQLPVLATEACIAAGAVVLAGVLPALYYARRSPAADLAVGAGTTTTRWQWRRRLIALQVAVSCCLLLVTAYCVDYIGRDTDRGDPLADVAAVNLPLELVDRDASAVDDLIAKLDERLGTISMTTMSTVGLSRNIEETSGMRVQVTTPDRPFQSVPGGLTGLTSGLTVATPGYFGALSLPRRHGRFFTVADRLGSNPVAVVSEHLAKRLFGRGNVAGERLLVRLWDIREPNPHYRDAAFDIVGVAGDADPFTFGTVEGMLYLPLAQQSASSISIVARSSRMAAAALVPQLVEAVRLVDATLPISFAGPADQAGQAISNAVLRILTYVIGGLGVLATLLAAVGLYGLASAATTARQREIAVRASLGAGRWRIALLILRDGTRPVLDGLTIGLGCGLVIRGILRAYFAAAPIAVIDPLSMLSVAVPLLLTGVLACVVPCLRALRLEPAVVLRSS